MMIFSEKGLCKRACSTFLRKNHRMAELLTWKKPRPALWDEADSPWYHPDSAWFICGTLTSVTGLPVLHYWNFFRTGCSRVNLQKFPSEGLSAGEPSLCHTGISLYCLCHCVLHIDDGSTIRNICQVAGSLSEWDPCFNRYCLRLAQTVTDFADASHSKSAKSTTTTVLYGIFSSENSYPCTVTFNLPY